MIKRTLMIAFFGMLLSACGGHGFEGKYEVNTKAEYIGNVASPDMLIGEDYIEVQGKRTDLEIFTRDTETGNYLVLKIPSNGQEKALEIIDNDTLKQKIGGVTVTFTRK